jgi:hypothetical protein
VVAPLRFCALGSGVGFCGNIVLVMGPYFRGGTNPILLRVGKIKFLVMRPYFRRGSGPINSAFFKIEHFVTPRSTTGIRNEFGDL